MPAPPVPPAPPLSPQSAGRRKKQNPWLAHVKDTMRKNRGVSFKKVLKLAKKTFKKSKSRRGRQSQSQSPSQSQSQSAGRKRYAKRGGFKLDQLLQQQDQEQKGGSGVGGGKEGAATLAGSAAPVA
jgi:hypothetical protein